MVFHFRGFELDPERFRLRHDGGEAHLEPRLVELLAYLVANRDRVVGKDELLDTVWGGAAVGESALARAVYTLRRALGDDARRQEMVRTVHGRGYQFVAPVTEVAAEADAAPAVAARGRHAGRPAAAVAALTVVLGAAIALWLARADSPRNDAAPAETAAAPAVVRLAVLPFTAAAPGPETELAALSLTELLWARLGNLPGLVVRSPELGGALGASAASLADLAAEARVDAVVTGSLSPAPAAGRLRLTVELHEATPGGMRSLPIGVYELPPVREAADLGGFVRVREAVADDVVEHLAPALAPALAAPAPGGIATEDAEALRLYLLARRRFATITCGDAAALLELLDRALARDPGFALAWVAQGFALYSQTWSCGRDVAFAHRALDAADRALAIEPGLPIAVVLTVVLHAELGDAEEAYARAADAARADPRSPFLAFATAYALRYAGFLAPATAALERSLELDPLVLRELGSAPLSLLYQRRYVEFLALLPSAEAPHDLFYRGLALARAGEPAAARAVLEPAFRLNPADVFARYAAALDAVLAGDAAAGADILREVARQREVLGTPDGEMTFKEAQLLALAGDTDGALGRLERSLAQGFFCPACLAGDPALARLDGDPRHAAVRAGAERRHRAFAERFGLAPELPSR